MSSSRRKFLGLAVAVVLGSVIYVARIYDFLAVTRPLHSRILVIEGWFPDAPQLAEAAQLIRAGDYEGIACVAVESWPAGTPGAVPNAERAAAHLARLGVDRSRISVLVAYDVTSGHTFRNALLVRSWLRREHPSAKSIDLFTGSVHARKSWVIYEKVLRPSVAVGVYATRPSWDPPGQWWRTRLGIYLVLRNTVGYLYAVVSPPPPE